MSVQQIEGDVLVAFGNGIEAEASAIEGVLGPLTITAVTDLENFAEGLAEKVSPVLGASAKIIVAQYGPEIVTWAQNAEKAGVPEFGAWLVSKGQALLAASAPAPAETAHAPESGGQTHA